jgi:transformation/transcription domain-associated protein
MRDVALLLLSKATEEQAMNVSDAFLKLREQILAYFNPESMLERHGGLNLINVTNLSFFDAVQKSELFRLKASFLQSLQGRSKANQAYCHSVQICPTHARAWDSWGELCASLGAVTEKQLEQGGTGGSGPEANKDAVKKVRQYLAQAMGCYLEAIQIDGHDWARIHIPKCLWMLTKDGSTPGVLCQTLESRGAYLPAWVWLPWIPQLLTSLYRCEGRAIKTIFARLVKAYPQAVYYPLRAFYLERRDVDRVKSSSGSASPVQHQGSVSHAEELMSMLRRSHASLWSSLESCLEELIVKFRPSYEEELLATIIVLLERAETQVGSIGKKDDEESVVSSVWKTLGKIAVKFFRPTEPGAISRDVRAEKTAQFKEAYKGLFESDFGVSASEQQIPTSPPESKPPLGLDGIIGKLRSWKRRLEDHVLASPDALSLIESSHHLAMFGVGDAPDLWPGSCDPLNPSSKTSDRESNFDTDAGTTQSTTSSSAAAARKAARSAAKVAAEAAMREGVSGDYGGGSSWIEVPGQYIPNTSSWTDVRPSPELHAKLLKFEPSVTVLRRSDTLVRRIGMLASDGKTYHFLLQFAVPYLTRTDERTGVFGYVLDKVLRKVIRSSRAQLSVQSHPVIPVAQRLRLISEPDGRTSLEDIFRQVCVRRKTNHTELPRVFNDGVKRLLLEKTPDDAMEEKDRLELEKAVRLDVYTKICTSDDADDMMLTDHLLSMLAGPELLFQFRRLFAQQWAGNCLLQYALSASERTPSKVVFDYCSGRVLAPEFRIAYTNQGCFETQPTPFRLSPNLESLIGFPLLDARFITSMAIIAGAVQSCHQDLDPIFRLLMRDDLVAFYTKSMAKSDSKTIEMEKQLAGNVGRNVAILHARFAECSPASKKATGEKQDHGPVDQRVRDLVDAARNPENLCMMSGSYQGWL